jgi:hypothetical protein
VNQFTHRRRIKAKPLRRRIGNKFGAGFVIGIQELLAAGIGLEMCFIFGGEKRAFVMIEPPGELVGGAIFEIYNGIFVAIKCVFIKQRAGAMHHRLKSLFPIGVNFLAIKTTKDSSGGNSIKTISVITNLNFHCSWL